jgi:alpha-ketoglutarate-dependent taurine dioxygenase
VSISFRPLSPVIGAEAIGFDPRNFTDEERDALQQAWYRNLVILIRGPILSDDEFVAFMADRKCAPAQPAVDASGGDDYLQYS